MATSTKTRKKGDFDLNKVVADKLIDKMENGSVPWQNFYLAGGLPMSMSTRRPYRGINTILLSMESADKGYGSRWWGTYAQAAKAAGCVEVTDETTGRTRWVHPSGQPAGVRKGEEGTLVTFWKRYERDAKDENGHVIIGPDGNPEKKRAALLRYFTVFNADQCDWPSGLPTQFAPGERGEDFDPVEAADLIVLNYTSSGGPKIQHVDQGMAWYSPAMDLVNVPNPENIRGNDEYYSALFHELTHSSGHSSRLDREGITSVGKHRRGQVYAFEELVAEFGAAMLCGQSGIHDTLDNSAAYLRGWAQYLRDDPAAAVKAATKAQAGVDHILGTTFENEAE